MRIMTALAKLISPLVTLLWVATPSGASLKDIRTDRLPQRESVQKALAETSAVEQFAQAWSDKWRYQTPKDVVASRLKDSLAILQTALASAPDNPELLLLTGLVAHYAYNVDVEEAYDVAVKSLQKAHQLASDDFRAEWFLGAHECQGAVVKEGMDMLLGVERRWPWDHLPSGFWDDYMSCASVANMPAHVLRAGFYVSKLSAVPSEYRNILMEIARKRFKTPELGVTYSGKDIWETRNENSRLVFTSYMCGFSFTALPEWNLHRLEVQKGTCLVQLETGPHPSKSGHVIPNLLMLARQAKAGEALDDFMKSFGTYPSAKAVEVTHCPSERCLAYEVMRPNAYGAAGNGYGFLMVFERQAPEFPGLLFEEPAGPEAPKDGKVRYFRPSERIRRMEGKLYYMVMLDTADSVLNEAKQDYNILLKHLKAE
jgi:hypothetical protein